MSCNHPNPPGYSFCGSCGEELEVVRCRCGFVAAAGDLFCGRCGAGLIADSFPLPNPPPRGEGANESLSEFGVNGTADFDHRFDLEHLVQQAAEENKFLKSTHKARVTQDDIRKLLATRRKKF